MSVADGYARVTNKPQAVIIHVNVGTQGLGTAVHNASAGRAPVLIFASMSPFTIEGEYRGSRTEYIHWLQDIPDQKQIISQYRRYTGEIKRGRNVKQLVNRALKFSHQRAKGSHLPYWSQTVRVSKSDPKLTRATTTKSSCPSDLNFLSSHLISFSSYLKLVFSFAVAKLIIAHLAIGSANLMEALTIEVVHMLNLLLIHQLISHTLKTSHCCLL